MAISKSTKEEVYKMVNEQGMTIEEVAQIRGVSRTTIVDYLSRWEKDRRENLYVNGEEVFQGGVFDEEFDTTFTPKKEYGQKVEGVDDIFPILCIGDIHEPFAHPNYLRFCKDMEIKYGCKSVVCLGDMVDNHYPSRHDTETDAQGGVDEYCKTKRGVARWVRAFPKVKYCLGNHDKIPERQASSLGLSSGFLKSFAEQWDIPFEWDCQMNHIIEDVLFTHGINCAGKDGALNLAQQERMSSVIGHAHSFLGCKYNANPRSLIFGMNVGCGIDVDAYAMRYGKFFKLKPTLGCGVVMSSSEAYSIPMTGKYLRS